MTQPRHLFRIWVAISLILVAMLVPHHHHADGVACVTLEFCDAPVVPHEPARHDDCQHTHGRHNGSSSGNEGGNSGHCSLKMPVVKVMGQRYDAHDLVSAHLLLPVLFGSLLPEPAFVWLEPRSWVAQFVHAICREGKHQPRRGPPSSWFDNRA